MMNIKNELITKVTPKTKGIFWITKESLSHQTPYIYEINYLFNGLLFQDIEKKKENKINLYLSQNYGETIFAAHLTEDFLEKSNEIKNILDIAFHFSTQDEIIILCQEKTKPVLSLFTYLESNFKDFNFVILKEGDLN